MFINFPRPGTFLIFGRSRLGPDSSPWPRGYTPAARWPLAHPAADWN